MKMETYDKTFETYDVSHEYYNNMGAGIWTKMSKNG